MKQIRLIMIVLFFATINGQAQYLKTGDSIPPLMGKNILNRSDSVLPLNVEKGKLLILNFWNQACGTATDNFPLIDSLQQEYRGKVRLVHVNQESKEMTHDFFKRLPNLAIPQTPLVTEGKAIWHLFSQQIAPFQVWIQNGKILEVTYPYNLTRRRLDDVLHGRRPIMIDLSRSKTIDSITTPLLQSRLMLCGHGNDPGNKNGIIEDNQVVISANCVSAKTLFIKAFTAKDRYRFKTSKEVDIQLDDSFGFSYPVELDRLDEWNQSYSYSYELKLPAYKGDAAFTIMQNELSNFFNVDAAVEQRLLPAYALVSTGPLDQLKTAGGKPSFRLLPDFLVRDGDTSRHLQNKPFSELTDMLRHWMEYYRDTNFENRVEFAGNIDIRISRKAIDPFNFQQLQADLLKYNLKLIPIVKMVDVLVIRDRYKKRR